jgi:hypothetical protein
MSPTNAPKNRSAAFGKLAGAMLFTAKPEFPRSDEKVTV